MTKEIQMTNDECRMEFHRPIGHLSFGFLHFSVIRTLILVIALPAGGQVARENRQGGKP
jgi:hypothetical protein